MSEKSPSIDTLGWDATFKEAFAPYLERGYEPARVAVEDKHHFILFANRGTFTGKVTGRLLHECKARSELPKVGDWVAFSAVPNEEEKALIHAVLPRRTRISRKVPGRETEEQVIVTNVDVAFIVQALDRTFNPARLQRHLAMVLDGGVKPVIVLNKADLCDDVTEKREAIERVAGEAPIVVVSAKTGRAMGKLREQIQPGQTVVFIGASGVGKSTLINLLYGDEILSTTEVRESDAKGRHTTTWRELIILPNGGLVIDTPGMREFQMWLAGETGQEAFADLEELALRCHFRSCSHTVEKRCAVLEAVASGAIARERYENYLKLKRELRFLDEAARKRHQIERNRTRGAQLRRNLRKPIDTP